MDLSQGIHTTYSQPEIAKTTDGKYVGVRQAGAGISGEVWFCIERDIMTKLGQENLTSLAALRSQIHAVKIFRVSKWDTPEREIQNQNNMGIWKEVTALKQIRNTAGSLANRFTELLAHNDENKVSTSAWFSMKAIHGFQLRSFQAAAQANKRVIPPEFTYHMFLQINEAVQFMQNCTPPICKYDLSALNVMIDPAEQDIRGFPNIKLIDFGGAKGDASVASCNLERWWLYRLVYDTAVFNHSCDLNTTSLFAKVNGAPECTHELEFVQFVDILRRLTKCIAPARAREFLLLEEEIQDRMTRILTIKRTYASQEALQAIHFLLQEAQKDHGFRVPTDEQILEAISSE